MPGWCGFQDVFAVFGEQPGAGEDGEEGEGLEMVQRAGALRGEGCWRGALLDVWRHLFGNPAVAAEAWKEFLDGPEEEVRRNAGRRSVPYNRVAWTVASMVPVVTLRAGSPPG